MYSPLYFLAALGAGGLAVSFFLMLMFWIPHPGQPIPVFSDWVLAFQTGSLWTQAMILVALSGVAFFVIQHLRLLILNGRMMAAFKASPEYPEFAASPMFTQTLAMPLTLAMTVNVSFVVGALFVPGLWSVVEWLFPMAMAAFFVIGVWALRLYGRVLRHAAEGLDIGSGANLAQVLPAFALAMVSVGFAAPAAMSHIPSVVGVSLVFSSFFALAAMAIAVVKTVVGLARMLEKGVDEAALPTLWIWVPILTVLGITLMRQEHGLSHTLGVSTPQSWLMPLVWLVSAQVLVLLLGSVAMSRHRYLARVWRGEIHAPSVFALICPGVALSVSWQFLVNKGFVAAGLVAKFGLTYWALTAVSLAVTVITVATFFTLTRGFLAQRASLLGHGEPLHSR